MKRKNYLILLTIMMVAMLSVVFVSCSKDDKDDELEQTENVSNQDPEGTIVLNMEGGASSNYYKMGDFVEIHIDAANNFRGKDHNNYKIEFVAIGKVGGLSKVNQIPLSGWAESAAVTPGTGYMMRYYSTNIFNESFGNPQYVRIYVVDYLTTTYTDETGNVNGSSSGATIKYQAPLQQKINFDNSSLAFNNTGNISQSVKLKVPTHLSVKEKPEWCKVTTYVDSVCVTVSENLGEVRKGNIVLSNVYGEATLSVSQSAIAAISFESSSIIFNSDASSQTVKLKTSTYVELENKPDWCNVQVSSDAIIISVTENLSASQRTGKINLKNSVGSASIDITQKASSAPLFEKGMGTEGDPYQIITAQQLENIEKSPSSHFILVSDIDLTSYLYEYGNGWEPIDNFTGKLNGNNHTISGMWIIRNSTDYIGLFKTIESATITNLILKIADKGLSGKSYVGGLCGEINNSTIIGCSVLGGISGSTSVGGIVGYSRGNSYIMQSYFNGRLNGRNDYGSTISGICGGGNGNSPQISECYTEGTLFASNNVYAICPNGEITDCYSIAYLEGSYCYGIGGKANRCYYAGKANAGTRFYCSGTYTYYDKNKIVKGYDDLSSDNARATYQMKTQSNYEGWDFTNTWEITERKTYPILRCFDKDQQEKSQWGSVADNYYLVGGSGCWCSSKEQKFQHSSKSIYEDPIFTYTIESNGTDMWFAFGDDEAIDAIEMGVWNKLYGTTGASEDLNGTFDRRYNLNGDNSFHVDGKANFYRFQINIANQTYTITELNSL